MGYTTPVLFYNDNIDNVIKYPEHLADALEDAACSEVDKLYYTPGGSFEALRRDHADNPRVLLVHQNSMRELNFNSYLAKNSSDGYLETLERDIAIAERELEYAKKIIQGEKKRRNVLKAKLDGSV